MQTLCLFAWEGRFLGQVSGSSSQGDWESAKYDLMKEAVRAKFTQHLRLMLLGTGEAEVVEHTERDSCWADGV